MSNKNHKNHTNYSKISTTPAVVEPTPSGVEGYCFSTSTTPAVVEPTPEIDNTPPAPPEPIDGIVSGCKRLNIRKEPSRSGEVICEVSEGTALMIDSGEVLDDWFRVYTEAGVEGYCMKNFVTIKP